MILLGDANCAGLNFPLAPTPSHEAYGVCEVCKGAFCKGCSLNLAILDEEIKRKLHSLLLGSLPQMICNGCGWTMTILYGNRFEGILPDTDVVGELMPVLRELDELGLHSEKVEDYFKVLAVVRRRELTRLQRSLRRVEASKQEDK